jgi:hypothetical protein
MTSNDDDKLTESAAPTKRRSIYSYPIAQRDNPAPGNEMIPMTSAQRAAFLAWYADFDNPNRISLAEFNRRHGIVLPVSNGLTK